MPFTQFYKKRVFSIEGGQMKNTKKYIKLAELLAKEITGENSEKENLKIFENDKEIRQVAYSVQNKILKSEHLNKYKSYNVQKARRKVAWRIGFVQFTKNKKLWNVLFYASVIILSLIIGGSFLL